jgi:uncharacterized protein (TIGR02391 family)
VSAKRITPKKDSVPPTIPHHQAITLLRRQAERADQIMSLRFDDPLAEVWMNSTTNILNQTFGQPNGEMHKNTQDFAYAQSGVSLHVNMTDGEIQADHEGRTKLRKALLLGFVEQLQDLAPPAAATAPDQYTFHPEIERVSGYLYRDGHYKQAALEAYIRVIEKVKAVSGLFDDGDSLMNKAFGADKQIPVIQFNSLSTEAERDEQRGIMYLFKGIVQLRNSKAHSNRLFNDPSRAHEYLALTSLLLRLLEVAQVNRGTGASTTGVI